jgi:WD40 repeat protein
LSYLPSTLPWFGASLDELRLLTEEVTTRFRAGHGNVPGVLLQLPQPSGSEDTMTSRLLKICVLSTLSGAGLAQTQGWTGYAYPPSTQCALRTDNPKGVTYESWISEYRNAFLGGSLTDGHQIQLAVTVIDGDDLRTEDRIIPLCGQGCCTIITSISVSTVGTVSWSRVMPSALQGGGPDRLSAEDLKVLRPLMASLREHLPDDYSQLPPPGRRVVVQIKKGNEIGARVYDRADMPDSVLEILGLMGATHGPLTMDFAPSTTRKREEFNEQDIPPDTVGIRRPNPNDPVTKALRADSVILAISPNRSLTVKRYLPFDRTVVIDAKTSAVFLEETDTTFETRWIYISHAWFTPDGRFLLLLSNLPAIRIYDTRTWRQVETLPQVPPGRVAYYPSSDWKHAIVVSPAGKVDLWDTAAGHNSVRLDLEGELKGVAFSPDDSLFAVTSIRQNKDQSSTFHLRIWDTKTGAFLRELRSFYYFAHDEIGAPMWVGNGKYLLGQSREGRFGGYVVGIWNVESGRFRGGFSGCADSIGDPFAAALSGLQLFDWCPDGKLIMWDVSPAIDKITEFEDSLNRLHRTALAKQH